MITAREQKRRKKKEKTKEGRKEGRKKEEKKETKRRQNGDVLTWSRAHMDALSIDTPPFLGIFSRA